MRRELCPDEEGIKTALGLIKGGKVKSVHILLASERLMEKPRVAVLVASQPMIDQGLAERLAALLGNQGIAT